MRFGFTAATGFAVDSVAGVIDIDTVCGGGSVGGVAVFFVVGVVGTAVSVMACVAHGCIGVGAAVGGVVSCVLIAAEAFACGGGTLGLGLRRWS